MAEQCIQYVAQGIQSYITQHIETNMRNTEPRINNLIEKTPATQRRLHRENRDYINGKRMSLRSVISPQELERSARRQEKTENEQETVLEQTQNTKQPDRKQNEKRKITTQETKEKVTKYQQ